MKITGCKANSTSSSALERRLPEVILRDGFFHIVDAPATGLAFEAIVADDHEQL